MPKKLTKLPPIHPCESLKTILDDEGITANSAALAMRIPANRWGAIINGQRGITPDTALRLGRFFGTSAQMWMNLQMKYDLDRAQDELAERIQKEVIPYRQTA